MWCSFLNLALNTTEWNTKALVYYVNGTPIHPQKSEATCCKFMGGIALPMVFDHFGLDGLTNYLPRLPRFFGSFGEYLAIEIGTARNGVCQHNVRDTATLLLGCMPHLRAHPHLWRSWLQHRQRRSRISIPPMSAVACFARGHLPRQYDHHVLRRMPRQSLSDARVPCSFLSNPRYRLWDITCLIKILKHPLSCTRSC